MSITLEMLSDTVARDASLHPALGLWVRNMRRDKDHGFIPEELCDAITEEIARAVAGSAQIAPAIVEATLCSHSGACNLRMCRHTTCSPQLSLVMGVASIAAYYTPDRSYAYYGDEARACADDIEEGRLQPKDLRGRLRGRLDYAWVTDASLLDGRLEQAPDTEKADAARASLGLSFRQNVHLVRIDIRLPPAGELHIATPTTIDAAGYLYFLASQPGDRHGWTLDLQGLARALPEWVISGLDASAAIRLSGLGRTGPSPQVNWATVFARFDQGEI